MAAKQVLFSMLAGLALLTPNAAAAPCPKAAFSHFVVVDQFGYTPAMAKIAVIRSPVTGYDAGQKFAPGSIYQVVEAKSCTVVFEGDVEAWNGGATDPSSGDKAWLFDFSAVTASGRYVIRDKANGETSGVFAIGPDPYRQMLVQAVRFFYYQRAGVAKVPPFADPRWTDKPDHVGPRQDTEARHLMRKDDPSSERDLHGGWWDAGDYNRYTNWHSDYLLSLLTTYVENPDVFTDDFNIPESGNGIPDLIDEVKFGMDWMVRMQNPDGSALAILGAGFSGSPPSSATQPSYYGGPSTSATYSAAASFAYCAKILARFPQFKAYAADLKVRAKRAWDWAEAHPDVTFFNKNPAYGDQTLGGGEQEVTPEGRALRAMTAAIYLFDLTGDKAYEDRLIPLAKASPLIAKNYFVPSDGPWLQPLLYYATFKSARRDMAADVKHHYAAVFNSDAAYGSEKALRNPYLAYLPRYYWGSTKEISRQGFFFLYPQQIGIEGTPGDAGTFAAHYLHYLHGVNPMAKVYLSNMGAFGAANSADSFFHAWFFKGTPWSSVKDSKYGPPPGYLVGGPNPDYNWEPACPALSPACGKAPPSPPFGQPAQKSYADINDGYPIDSWQTTEPSAGYQVEYIRLLAHFVAAAKK
jgi:endoglucanase